MIGDGFCVWRQKHVKIDFSFYFLLFQAALIFVLYQTLFVILWYNE